MVTRRFVQRVYRDDGRPAVLFRRLMLAGAHIVLEEIGKPFEAVRIDTRGGEHKQPEYLKINPKARVPALSVGDWVLTENPAILQYLARRHPEAGLWPTTLEDQARCAARVRTRGVGAAGLTVRSA